MALPSLRRNGLRFAGAVKWPCAAILLASAARPRATVCRYDERRRGSVLAIGDPPAIASDPGRECGALPRPLARRIEAGMSAVSPPESRSTALPAPPVVARAGPETRAALPTPLFTRHMLGAIEAARDRRRAFHAT